MNDKYKNGTIYRITDIAYTKCYIGSTIEPLPRRMAKHRTNYKNIYNGKSNLFITSYDLFNEYGIKNCKIELIEYFPCNNKVELTARLGHYIKNENCVNKKLTENKNENLEKNEG